MIDIENICKSFGPSKVLKNIDIHIPKEKIVILLGPNGSGKTSLVKSILGLLWPSEGTIKINGKLWSAKNVRNKTAYLPEKFSFYHTYRALDVLNFYLKMNEYRGDIKAKSLELLLKVGLKDHIHKKIVHLSKGQLQRLALATCMLPNKELIILDEPFSGLDPFGINELKGWISDWKNEGKTVLINTHLIGEISNIVEYVIILNEGVICETINLQERNDLILDEYFIELIKEKRNEPI